MPAPGRLTREQVSEIVCLYQNGVFLKDIREKYGISDSTIRHHVKHAGLETRCKKHTPRDGVRVLEKEKLHRCLKCRKMFAPYAFGYSINRNVCFDCWMKNTAIDLQSEHSIGRDI